jgi:uncharacterized membrane protein
VSTTLRALHVLGAITWLGGMFFIALVLVPVARRLDDAALRRQLVHALGLRFRVIGWVALGVLLATGVANVWFRPYLLSAPRFHVKLGLVVVALVLSALHDFWIGPRAGEPGADPAWRVRASWLARVNVLVVVAIVVLGVALRG